MLLNRMKNFFRIVAFLEGVSYILLLFMAVPLKYWGGDEQYVKLLGMPHGLLFVGYIILAFLIKDDVTQVVVPAFEGEMGILKDHISIISFLKPGIIKIISNLDGEIVGADIVEYNPRRDINNITAITAAKLLKELMGQILK